jgi:hypothetical protein
MWQEVENGAVTFQVRNMIFWVDHPGALIFRKPGTMNDRKDGGWTCIGTLNTEEQDEEWPDDDIPAKWAFHLSDDVLLSAPAAPGHPEWL